MKDVNKRKRTMWNVWVAVLCVLKWNINFSEAACTFPSSLTGIWHGSDLGQAVFTSSQFTLSSRLVKVDSNTFVISQFNAVTFNCEQQIGDLYYIKSDEFRQYFADFRITMCWKLISSSTSKIVYNSAMSVLLNTTNSRFLLKSASSTFSMATECILNGPYDSSSVRVLVKDGDIASAAITCPSALSGTFSYEFDSGSGNQCTTDSYVDSCTDETLLAYNYTLCSAVQAYSAEGQLHCVYYVTSGDYTYVTVYNKDSSTPDELTKFRFSCYSIHNLTATQYPQACMQNQNDTVYVSPGALITFNRSTTCPETPEAATETLMSAATIVSIIVVLMLLIGGLIIFFYCWKKTKKNKKISPEADPLGVKAPPVDHFDRVGSSMSRCGAISPYSPYPTLSEIAVFRFGPSPIPDCDGGTTLGGTIAAGLPEEAIAQALQQRYEYDMVFDSDTETNIASRPVTQGNPDNISLPMYSENGISTPEPTRIREVFDQVESSARKVEYVDHFPTANEAEKELEQEKSVENMETIKQNGSIPKQGENQHPNESNFIYSENDLNKDVDETNDKKDDIISRDYKKEMNDTMKIEDDTGSIEDIKSIDDTIIEDDTMPIVDKDFNK